jgi:hypothetical protein
MSFTVHTSEVRRGKAAIGFSPWKLGKETHEETALSLQLSQLALIIT